MERRFLELMQYSVTIRASAYASYYFELRSLCERQDVQLRPLAPAQAARLQARTERHQETLRDEEGRKEWSSLPAVAPGSGSGDTEAR